MVVIAVLIALLIVAIAVAAQRSRKSNYSVGYQIYPYWLGDDATLDGQQGSYRGTPYVLAGGCNHGAHNIALEEFGSSDITEHQKEGLFTAGPGTYVVGRPFSKFGGPMHYPPSHRPHGASVDPDYLMYGATKPTCGGGDAAWKRYGGALGHNFSAYY
jgi:hypothetical protein